MDWLHILASGAVSTGVYVLSAAFVLGLVVVVHEYGHYAVGRWCGVGAERFSIGFGPEIAGFTSRSGTRWRIAAIPLGGYVKFVGDRDAASTGTTQVAPALRDRAFGSKSVYRRMAIIAGGPAANFLLSFVILTVLSFAVGELRFEPRVGSVQEDSAAARAGLEPGDLILSIDGARVSRAEDVSRIVMTSAQTPLSLAIERDGRELTIEARPQRVAATDAAGIERQIGRLGVTFEDSVFVRYGPLQAAARGAERTLDYTALQVRFLWRLLTGQESVKELGGPLGIAHVSGNLASRGFEGAAGPTGLTGALFTLIQVAAAVSISIGLVNLLPIPILDGGHLVFLAYEALVGRPLSPGLQEFGYRIGLALLLGAFFMATWSDLGRFGLF